ncbi:MAG: hypothetical protein JNJ57_21575 [Saprospiraceae bacterium]|nr:hypothetical protein [Saprospiraceae bacterium]
MNKTFHLSVAFLIGFTTLLACNKNAIEKEVTVDIDIQEPNVIVLPGGERAVEIVVIVTQLGNSYFKNYHSELRSSLNGFVLDSMDTFLPTAREFVTQNFVVPGPGNYFLWARVGSEFSNTSRGTAIQVP